MIVGPNRIVDHLCSGRPERPQKELHQQKEKLTLKWKAPCDNGDSIREYTLEMCAVNTQTYRGSPSNEIRKIIYTGRAEQYTLGEKKKDALRKGLKISDTVICRN